MSNTIAVNSLESGPDMIICNFRQVWMDLFLAIASCFASLMLTVRVFSVGAMSAEIIADWRKEPRILVWYSYLQNVNEIWALPSLLSYVDHSSWTSLFVFLLHSLPHSHLLSEFVSAGAMSAKSRSWRKKDKRKRYSYIAKC